MSESIEDQINALERMTTTELVERFAEVHGYPTRGPLFQAACSEEPP